MPPDAIAQPDFARDALILDIDGTLIEIAPTPESVIVPPALHSIIAALAKRFDGAIAYCSGRTMAVVDHLMAPPRLAAIACHGAEIRSAPDAPVSDGLDDYADRDLVVEAVFEDADLKRDVFRRLDAVLPAPAGLASNTSSISIASLASAVSETRRPRFVGTHFFSPVSRMRLVEVIPAMDTDPSFADEVSQLLASVGKTPIRVKDVVGFAVNRLLHAMVLESIRLVEEGVCSAADIDAACKLGLGHPIGPFELMDNTANSLSQSVHEILYAAYGERFLPRPLLRQLVAAGYEGRKAGRGWHRYDKDGKRL